MSAVFDGAMSTKNDGRVAVPRRGSAEASDARMTGAVLDAGPSGFELLMSSRDGRTVDAATDPLVPASELQVVFPVSASAHSLGSRGKGNGQRVTAG
jgi:hypothetical protein